MTTPQLRRATEAGTSAQAVTVRGPVRSDTLGVTLPAEHLVADLAPVTDTVDGWVRAGRRRPATVEAWRFYREPLTMPMLGDVSRGVSNRDNWRLSVSDAAAEVDAFSVGGGGTIVDLTTPDLGRDPQALLRLAQSSTVAVIMGCGWSVPPRAARDGRDADDLAREIIAEFTTGVDGIRAGVIGRIGPLDPGSAPGRIVLDAVAQASAATGAPTLIRPPRTCSVHQVLDRLNASGAKLSRVAVECSGSSTLDRQELTDLADRGVFVQFGELGRFPHVYNPADGADVAAAIHALDEAGHTGQILLSPGVGGKSDLMAFGGGGYTFLADQFLPFLRSQGADDRLVDAITIKNPRRWLTIEEGRA